MAMRGKVSRVWTSSFRKIVIIAALINFGSAGTGDCVRFRGGETAGPSQAGFHDTNSVSLLRSERGASRNPRPNSEYWFRKWVKGVQYRYAESRRHRHIPEAGPPQILSKQIINNHELLVVNKRGRGQFTSVQAAIDFVPHGNNERVVIFVTPGVYEEKVLIPKSKPYLTLKGGGREVTLITWYAAAHDSTANGTPLGTFASATFGANSNHFVAYDISFQNTAPHPEPGMDGWQAVAVRVSGDYAAFYNCGFFGGQDTLYDHRGRHYFKNCYIEGSIDYIFGHGQSLYVGTTLHSIGRYGSLTAQKRSAPDDKSGFSFVNCTVRGTAMDLLGRAWGQFSRVIYAYTYMDDIVIPNGWNDWDDPSRESTVYYGQYKCSGPGSNPKSRVAWSRELADDEAEPFIDLSFIDGYDWLPKTTQYEFLELQTSLKQNQVQLTKTVDMFSPAKQADHN